MTGLDAPANYSYNVLTDNVNGITTRGFSITARDDMYVCESTCPYVDFDKFVNYYGEFDYADQWVQSAYDTTLTVFDNGNADFRNYYTPGKTGKNSFHIFWKKRLYIIYDDDDDDS